jgi:hypothetical protein
MFVYCVCCVDSGLCDVLIAPSEEPCWLRVHICVWSRNLNKRGALDPRWAVAPQIKKVYIKSIVKLKHWHNAVLYEIQFDTLKYTIQGTTDISVWISLFTFFLIGVSYFKAIWDEEICENTFVVTNMNIQFFACKFSEKAVGMIISRQCLMAEELDPHHAAIRTTNHTFFFFFFSLGSR